MVAVEGWSLPRKSEKMETNRNKLPIEGVFEVWESVRKYDKQLQKVKKGVPCRSPRRCPPYFRILTAFNTVFATYYYFLLLLTKFSIFCTTCLLRLCYSVTIVFASVQYVVAVFCYTSLLHAYYFLLCVTTSLLHVYYLLLHVYYFLTTCLLLFIFLLHFTCC